MRKWFFTIRWGLLSSLAISVTAWCVEVEKVEEKTFDFSSGGSISVMADDGSITIKTWNRESVHLRMTKRAWGRSRHEAERLLEDIDVRIQESRNRLVIKELDRDYDNHFNFFDIFDGDFWREKGWRSVVVDFELTVPQKVELRLQTDEGDIEVSGTDGKLTVDVDEGEVDLEDVVSDYVQIGIDEGDISFHRVKDRGQGLWKIDADEGSIFIEEGSMKEVDVETDEGEIILRNVITPRFWLRTDEGDIEADFRPTEGGSYRMETDEGDLEIYIPEDTDLDVRLQTYEGRIDSDFDLYLRSHDDGESAEGMIGRGNGRLKALADEGDIIFRKEYKR
jgi:DUF4097 and DUF4098 domain-containing protein YvlB